MFSLFRSVAPGHSAKINLIYDYLAIAAIYVFATLVALRPIDTSSSELFVMILLSWGLWAVGSSALQLYDPFKVRVPLDEVALVTLLIVALTLVLGFSKFVIPEVVITTPRTGDFFLLLWVAIIGPRMLVFRRLATREGPLDDVLIVGTGPLARHTGKRLESKHPRRRVVGYLRLPAEAKVSALPQQAVLGCAEADLERTLREVPVGEVYIAGKAGRDGAVIEKAIRICEKFGVPFALPAVAFPVGRSRLVALNWIPDGFLHFVTFESRPAQRAVKRLFDIVMSAAAVLALSPLFLVVAAAIKLTSRGPIFFKQNRVGLHGRPFKMLKFRSMVVNAEELKARLAAQNEQTGPVFKIRNDPRITRVGRFIRKYSIDELPQLINVLRGDMSIVGPRPPVPPEVVQYEAWQRRRLSVRPGLTCIWQVSGRNQISFEEWMYLDMQYIDHWSLKSDLELILKTFPVVLTGRGAS